MCILAFKELSALIRNNDGSGRTTLCELDRKGRIRLVYCGNPIHEVLRFWVLTLLTKVHEKMSHIDIVASSTVVTWCHRLYFTMGKCRTILCVRSISDFWGFPSSLHWQKANGQLEKTTGPPSQRLAQQGPGGCQRPTAIYAVEIWDRQGSWSGATIHSDYATTMVMIAKYRRETNCVPRLDVEGLIGFPFQGTSAHDP